MFEQYIGDGASLFITIVACIIGFVAAVSFMDSKKTKKNQEESH